VVFVGNTSMAVLANVYAENIAQGSRRHANECWLTFVHLGLDGKPTAVPQLTLETAEDRLLHEVAERRRAQSLAERR
jgi:acyl-CoA hydrolase